MTEAVFPHLHKYGGGVAVIHMNRRRRQWRCVIYEARITSVVSRAAWPINRGRMLAGRRWSVRSFGAFASLHVGGGAVGGYGQGRKGGSGQLQQGFLDLILNRELDGREDQETVTIRLDPA